MADDRSPWDPPSFPSSELLRCSVCDKGFEQRSSRDRHLRRCRQKQIWGSVPRKKSCAVCTQAKTRCDLQTPSCSRCRTKGLACHYYYQPPPQPPPQPLQLALPTTQLVRRPAEGYAEYVGSIPTPACTECGQGEDVADGGGAGGIHHGSISDAELANWGRAGHNLLEWNIYGGTTADLEFRHGTCSIGTPISPMTPYTPHYVPEEFRMSGPRQVSVPLPSKQMRKRLLCDVTPPPLPPELSKDAFVFMDRVVRCYSKMMTGRNSPPPFVHVSHLVAGKISSALAICRGLVDMYKTMTRDNRTFVMRTIAQEHSRILSEVDLLWSSELERVGMLQAALVYGLIRHYENDHTLDEPTMDSIKEMAINIGLRAITAKGELENLRPNWEEWILAESRRRTLLTIFILNISYRNARNLPPTPCPEVSDILLPTIRILWEAADRVSWEFDYENYLADLRGRRLPRMRDILEPGAEYVDLEEWLTGIDGFGLTIMSLVEQGRGMGH